MDQSVWDTIAQWSEIIGGVAFIVVAVWLFRKLVLPVIVRTTERKNAELLDAEKHRDALRARVAEARERVAEADREASAIEARAFGDAQREHEQIVDEARREGTRLLLNAQGELERARIAARDRFTHHLHREGAATRARAGHRPGRRRAQHAARRADHRRRGQGEALMPNETLARRYATAIFQLASEAGAVDAVSHDLHTFVAALGADQQVDRFFRSPVIDREEKSAVIAQAFDRLNEIALHAILLLIRKRRETLVNEIVRQYDILERQARGAQPLTVTSARKLDPGELDALIAKLSAAFKTTFDVTQRVDPKLIGGVRLTIGDKRVDGSIAGRLNDLARMLSTN